MNNMRKYVKTYSSFVNENVNEGEFTDKLKTGYEKGKEVIKKAYSRLKEYVVDMLSAIGIKNREITSGDKAGTMLVETFDIKNGSIEKQLLERYADTEYGKQNLALKESFLNSFLPLKLNEGTPINLEHPDAGIENVNTGTLKKIIKLQYKKTLSRMDDSKGARRTVPTFIYGAPGIGKTSIVAQVCDELGISLVTISAALLAKEDFTGLPYVDTDEYVSKKLKKAMNGSNDEEVETSTKTSKRKSRFAAPDFLPSEEGTGGILFLDELNTAAPHVFNSLLQFIQLGLINQYQLPGKWVIVAAGNREDEATVLDMSSKAMIGRFRFCNYVPNKYEWLDWAEKYNNKTTTAKIDDSVIDFIRSTAGDEWFFSADSEDRGPFANPRDWAELGIELTQELNFAMEEGETELDWADIERLAKMAVGKEAASAFLEYTSIKKYITEKELVEILNPDKIVNFISSVKTSDELDTESFSEAQKNKFVDKLLSICTDRKPQPSLMNNDKPKKWLMFSLVDFISRVLDSKMKTASSDQSVAMLMNAFTYLMQYNINAQYETFYKVYNNKVKDMTNKMTNDDENSQNKKAVTLYSSFLDLISLPYTTKNMNAVTQKSKKK